MTQTILAPSLETADSSEAYSGFETMEELQSRVVSKLHVLGDQEVATDGPVMGFVYDGDNYDTHIEVSDEEGYYDVELTLPDFLQGDTYDERPDSWLVRRDIKEAIAAKYLAGTDGWWFRLDEIEARESFEPHYFERHKPTELLTIGQGDKAIRFFNYGEPMTQARVDDCRIFVDIVSQYFAERTYDLLADVVIAPFDNERQAAQKGEADGFVHPTLPKTLFIDSRLLQEGNQETSTRLQAGRFLEVLTHEFGHLAHGDNDQAETELLDFARAVGWDVDRMIEERPLWSSGYEELRDYAPSDDYVVTHEDGSQERVPLDTYHEEHGDVYEEDGTVKPGKPFYRLGSPSDYGETNPRELSAETTTYSVLGDYVVRQMPETRDAWLEHMRKRILKPGETPEDRPIATPIHREDAVVTRKAGAAIEYPRTELPDTIYVRALQKA